MGKRDVKRVGVKRNIDIKAYDLQLFEKNRFTLLSFSIVALT